MTLTDRDRKIALLIVPVLAIVGYWFLLLAPKREEASLAADEVAKQEQRRDQAQAQVSAAKGVKADFAADYSQIVRLGKAIPASVDMPSLIVQLDEAAEGTGIVFTKIKMGERAETPAAVAPPAAGTTSPADPAAAGGAPAQSAPGAAAEAANTTAQTANQASAAADQSGVSPADTQTSTSSGGGLPVGGGSAAPAAGAAATPPAGLETVPLELEFTGNFFNLADFFHGVKRFVRVANQDVIVGGRLVTIEGVRWSSDPELFPKIRAELKATVYLSPKVEGATAGATPGGPSATTPTAATPAPAASSPPPVAAPTATATP